MSGALALAFSGLFSCNTMFEVAPPEPERSTIMPACPSPSVDAGGWQVITVAGPTAKQSARVERAVLLGKHLVYATNTHVLAVGLATDSSNTGTAPSPAALILDSNPSTRARAQAVRGIARVMGEDSMLAVLVCRWQEGCTINLVREEAWVGQAQVDSNDPCGEPGTGPPVPAAHAYACLPFASTTREGEIPFAVSMRSDGTIAACVTQGEGGAEGLAATLACVVGKPDENRGRRILGTESAPEVVADLQATGLTILHFSLGAAPNGGGDAPVILIAREGYYALGTSGSQDAEDRLPNVPSRTIHSYSQRPWGTLLGMEQRELPTDRHVIGVKRHPTTASEPETPYQELAHRPGRIVAVDQFYPSSPLFWVERLSPREGPYSGLYMRREVLAQDGSTQSCAERIADTLAIGKTEARTTIMTYRIPQHNGGAGPESGRANCSTDVVFVVADGSIVSTKGPPTCTR